MSPVRLAVDEARRKSLAHLGLVDPAVACHTCQAIGEKQPARLASRCTSDEGHSAIVEGAGASGVAVVEEVGRRGGGALTKPSSTVGRRNASAEVGPGAGSIVEELAPILFLDGG